MAQEDYQKGYWRDGCFYNTPEEEIKFYHKALESARNRYKNYERGWKLMGGLGSLYLGLRLIGYYFGVGSEIDVMEPATLDSIAGILISLGLVSKLGSFLTSPDVKNSKKDFKEAVKRFGFKNSKVEKIVTENSQ